MLSVARQPPMFHPVRPMDSAPKNTPPGGPDGRAALLGRALANLRQRANLSQPDAGERAGMTGQAWGKYERGLAPGIFHPATQERLTAALGATPDDLERERLLVSGGSRTATVHQLRAWPEASRPSTLPIRDRVQAGAWLQADDTDQAEPRRYPFARDPRFPHADQWLSEVFGDSVDRLGIFDGDLVLCVDFGQAGVALQTDQLVEVERIRFGGQLRELSIKQVELTPSGPILWPRSSNPRWQTPLSLEDGVEEDDAIVRVRGLVLKSIRNF